MIPENSNMISIIEGVGDEVVYCLGMACVVLVLVLAWSSTSVTDHSLIRTAVLVIERPRVYMASLDRQRRSFVSGTASNSTAPPDDPSSSRAQDPAPSGTTTTGADSSSPPPADPAVIEADKPPVDSSGNPTETTPSDVAAGIRLHERSVPDGAADAVSSGEQTVLEQDTASDAGPTPAAGIATVDGRELPASTADGNIRVRLKFLNDTQKLVEAQLDDRLGNFKRQHFGEEIGNNRVVRLIFNGQLLLRDQETLQFHGLHDNCVVHCHISSAYVAPAPAPAASPVGSAFNGGPQVELDVGRLMLPLFGLILGLIWCCRLQYRQYFNATSTLALLCITGLFVVSVLAVCMPERRARGHAHAH